MTIVNLGGWLDSLSLLTHTYVLLRCSGAASRRRLGAPRVLSLSHQAFTPMGRPNDSEASRVLSNLHTDLAWHLKSRLDDGSISTAELNILRQFLKDNGISAQPVAGTSFGDLVASLPDMDKIVQMPRRKVA